MDICYITPDGRRLRTFPEIQRHLDLKSNNLSMEHFTFSKKVELGETLDTEAVSGCGFEWVWFRVVVCLVLA